MTYLVDVHGIDSGDSGRLFIVVGVKEGGEMVTCGCRCDMNTDLRIVVVVLPFSDFLFYFTRYLELHHSSFIDCSHIFACHRFSPLVPVVRSILIL